MLNKKLKYLFKLYINIVRKSFFAIILYIKTVFTQWELSTVERCDGGTVKDTQQSPDQLDTSHPLYPG